MQCHWHIQSQSNWISAPFREFVSSSDRDRYIPPRPSFPAQDDLSVQSFDKGRWHVYGRGNRRQSIARRSVCTLSKMRHTARISASGKPKKLCKGLGRPIYTPMLIVYVIAWRSLVVEPLAGVGLLVAELGFDWVRSIGSGMARDRDRKRMSKPLKRQMPREMPEKVRLEPEG